MKNIVLAAVIIVIVFFGGMIIGLKEDEIFTEKSTTTFYSIESHLEPCCEIIMK